MQPVTWKELARRTRSSQNRSFRRKPSAPAPAIEPAPTPTPDTREQSRAHKLMRSISESRQSLRFPRPAASSGGRGGAHARLAYGVREPHGTVHGHDHVVGSGSHQCTRPGRSNIHTHGLGLGLGLRACGGKRKMRKQEQKNRRRGAKNRSMAPPPPPPPPRLRFALRK